MNIVVTGGSSGLGAALIERLRGHSVWNLDRSEPASQSPSHHYMKADLSSASELESAVAELPANIDGLANVAGIATADDPALVVGVNFLGMRHLSELVAPRLAPGGGIVNVSSIAGRDWRGKLDRLRPLLETDTVEAGFAWCRDNEQVVTRDAYTLSKRLVTAYTAIAAKQALGAGYTVNCVSPGPINTPLYPTFESLMGKAHSDWTVEQTGRAAEPGDIAEVVAMLLEQPCGWLNGVDIPVDGGYSAGLDAGWIDFTTSPAFQRHKR